MCLHFDDMLGTGDDRFELKLGELDKLVGFGSIKRRKFEHCGSQYEKHADGEITISTNAHIQNLKKASQTLQRTKKLHDELCNKGVTLALSVRCESAPTESRTGSSTGLAQSK